MALAKAGLVIRAIDAKGTLIAAGHKADTKGEKRAQAVYLVK